VITFDPDALAARRDELEQELSAPGFWDDQAHAAAVSSEHARVVRKLERYERLSREYEDAVELLELDGDMSAEIAGSIQPLRRELDRLQEDALFSGEYDAGDAVVWNGTIVAKNFSRSTGDAAAVPAYWSPAVRFLRGHLTPSFRVEAVDTTGHWPAEYLPAAGIPIVRGWYRQDDFPENRLLYRGFGPHAYRTWLRGLGVRYVVLAAAKPDYSARAEAGLLRSGRSGLVPVLLSPTVSVYELPRAEPIVTGPAHADVRRLRPSQLLLEVGAPGTYRVSVHYSPYWLATPGCVSRRADGTLALTVPRAGPVDLDFRVSTERALQTLAGVELPRCSSR
jgi:hypothetical protein